MVKALLHLSLYDVKQPVVVRRTSEGFYTLNRPPLGAEPYKPKDQPRGLKHKCS